MLYPDQNRVVGLTIVKYLTLLCAGVLFPQFSSVAYAETLSIDSHATRPPYTTRIASPVGGQPMRKVRNLFGEPETILPAVGEPPITRWVYPDFTVYFEHQQVITSVMHR